MKFRRVAILATAIFALSSFALAPVAHAQAREKCVIANSPYTGWEPIWLAKELGILKKWGDKYNVDLDVTPRMDYAESITQFTAKQFCGLAVTNMDALTGPAAGGVDTTFIVVGDYSNGNDALLWRSAKTPSLKDLPGKKVVLVEFTVSHYMLWRAAQIHGFAFNKVRVENAASDTDVKNAFNSDESIVVTWHPNLLELEQRKNAKKLFDSSMIPGEIIDGIVVQSNVSENVKKAIVGAWYEVMAVMANKGSPEYKKAIQFMANFSAQTDAEFETQLKTTALFTNPKDAVLFIQDPKLKQTMNHVRTFAAELDLLVKGKGKDSVGIQFPDGSVVGDAKNVTLRFDTKYMQMAADGKL